MTKRNDRDRMRDRWHHMKTRCYDENYHSFHRYGGRGIKVCDRWLNSFQSFIDDMGYPPFEKAQLDRIDNNGNYEPSYCRWVTAKENANNRKPFSNKTGYSGVSYKKKIGKYCSQFYVNRKAIHVGSFKDPITAYKKRVEAIKKYNEENNTNIKYIELEDL